MRKRNSLANLSAFEARNIVLTSTGLARAGAECQVRDLALAFTQRGHRVTLATLTQPRAFAAELTAAGVDVIDLGMQKHRVFRSFFVALLTLRRVLKATNPDIVHAHMVHANILTRLASAGLRVPVICTAHNTTEGGAVRDWAYRLTNFLSSVNTTISQAATKRFVDDGVFPEKSTLTVYNGIDLQKYVIADRVVDRQFRWIAIGRLTEQKDYPTLLQAVASLPDVCLDIVGQGELESEVRCLISSLNLENRVRLLGLRADIPSLLHDYDGFVLSSAWEGFGIVIAEAMASGLPVVATRSGGPQEVIGEGNFAGILVEPGSPSELSRAMQFVEGMTALERQLMGLSGRRRVEAKFDLEHIVEQWLEIYNSAITPHG